MSQPSVFEQRLGLVDMPLVRLLGQFLLLLFCLKLNTKVFGLFPGYWIFLPLTISVFLLRSASSYRPLTELWSLVGALSAVYSLFHYPLLPALDGQTYRYAFLILIWMISLASGALCFSYPSLSIIPPAFLLWSELQAHPITGLPTTTDIDIRPLFEVSMTIGIGLVIDRLSRFFRFDPTNGKSFPALLLLLAVAVHLANYFWSFVAKAELGKPWTWVLQNNPANIFLTALDDNHVLFSAYPSLVSLVYRVIDMTHVATNIGIFAIQGLALFGLLFSNRIFILLLIAFDCMHLAIALIAGANFWPWIILNAIIAFVVVRSNINRIDLKLRLLATAFIVIGPAFVTITKLGWLDSGANNKLYFEAVYADGTRSYVPTNFFTFYSYYFAHMDYGLPNPDAGVDTAPPNGGVYDLRLLRAAATCDTDALRVRQPEGVRLKRDAVVSFVRNYHTLAVDIERRLGAFPFNLYPHHFYVPAYLGSTFEATPKKDIVAYVYRQESVCLSFSDHLVRKVVGTGEYRIDVR